MHNETLSLGNHLHRSWVLLAMLYMAYAPTIARGQIFGFQPAEQDVVSMYLFNGKDEAGFKRNLETSCQLRVDRVAEVVGLTEDQRSKLELAIRGDLSRVYREMEKVRQKTKGLNMQDQADMQKAWQEISPLYQRFQNGGVIDENSLYENVLASVLDEQQREQFQQYLDGRRQFKMQALAAASLSEMEKQMPLLADQREQLIKLVRQVPVPRKANGMHAYVGYAILGRVKRNAVADILDENQLKVYDDLIKQFGRIGGIQW